MLFRYIFENMLLNLSSFRQKPQLGIAENFRVLTLILVGIVILKDLYSTIISVVFLICSSGCFCKPVVFDSIIHLV